jgi:hypothetical protein
MAIYRLTRPKGTTTMKFNSYNAAIAFAKGSGLLNPSKPYKRVIHNADGTQVIWCVTLPALKNAKATYTKLAA